MGHHKIKRGLDLPIGGAPEQRIEDAARPSRVGLIASDYIGLKPTMRVEEGDDVLRGQILFEHKNLPGVRFTSPGAGKISGIVRGAKRALQSVSLRLHSNSREEQVRLGSFTGRHPSSLSNAEVRELLLESGLWTALRTRPYGGTPGAEDSPHSIFVTAFDSEPLAPHLDVVASGREDDWERGLLALVKLTSGLVHVCRRPGSSVAVPEGGSLRNAEFSGPHPAGTAGVHIHLIDPVDRSKTVWYLGLQDTLAIGRLFHTGEIETARVISLGGPSVRRPRLLRTRIGASIDDLLDGEIEDGARVVSGSVLSGRAASGPIYGYLGRYDQQITALPEGDERRFLGWLAPGFDRFSTSRTFISKLLPKRVRFSTTTFGDQRTIVPIGLYERVMPMDLMSSFLLKALVSGDVERAEELGVLELEEQDLALCTFVCPSKIDYGPHLRQVLTTLEKEG